LSQFKTRLSASEGRIPLTGGK
jgi:hypothetical protein